METKDMVSIDMTVVLPIYNEEANINTLYDRLTIILKKMQLTYELLFVNDGSTDQSLKIIKSLAMHDTQVKYLDFSRNFGHQIAVTAGLNTAKGKTVTIIDADLQDPPELIPNMYEKIMEGWNVVYARRRNRKGEGILKKITAKLFYRLLTKVTSVPIPLDTGDFRIIDKKIIQVLKNMPEQSKFLRGQISWIGFKQTFVEYDRDPRYGGKTGYTYRKMIRFALDGITAFSNIPLKIASLAGFIVSGISFLLILYSLYGRFILKNYAPGWASIMISVLFLGGIQLICLGIIGEYISRMNINIRNRPLYIVNESNIEYS
ncbi:glycosyltransferase family 2 protein [Rhodocytophaga aerolata]|uniref:Glycosyltransferase family 2 protein n=1 Tax=Rhodocytophaga aerolata TaxID=455078 RepID=A0ABT8R1P9_9BACT|nr:glycosyltransferase family 2 protein [Rhodocytophaga aerolata]MDO1446017.1 glycosyltransferase family 2 protein [Rhodocytophaga aerolata]